MFSEAKVTEIYYMMNVFLQGICLQTSEAPLSQACVL